METDVKININLIPIPDHKEVERYKGMTVEEIKEIHPVYEESLLDTENKNLKTIEIRLPSATLTCVIQENVCIEAYLFED